MDPAVDELRAREQHYRALLEALPDMLFRGDRHGTYLEAWPQDRPDLIVRASDIVGRSVHDLFSPELAGKLQDLITGALATGKLGILEYDLEVRGELLTFEARVVPCGAGEILALVRNVTARKRREAEVRSLQRALQAQLVELQASRARIVEAADAERRRVERDIHDGAQQRLLAVRLSLQLAVERLRQGDAAGARSIITEADLQLEGAVDELRALAHGIYPAVLTDEGIGAALQMLARRSPVPVRLVEVPGGRLPAPAESALYFIASEALCNVVKHAKATCATVTMRQDGARLSITVDDDGVGGAHESGGSGLRGLRDRVEAFGGDLEIRSAPGGGTRLRAASPCG